MEFLEIMCHLILLLPVFGLAVFVLMPFAWALAAYLVIAGATILLYRAVIDAMRRPVTTGREGLQAIRAQVSRVDGDRILVRARGELWYARPTGFTRGGPHPGDHVVIREVCGNGLLVGPISGDSTD